MSAPADITRPAGDQRFAPREPPGPGPFLHSGEDARRMHLVMLRPALAVLVAGAALCGWRSAAVAAISIGSCVAFQWVLGRLTRRAELRRGEQACLVGTLLALTLPPFVPWYVPVLAAAFAMALGATPFALCRRGLWQAVVIGRFAVAVIVPAGIMAPQAWPVLLDGPDFAADITRLAAPPDALAPHADLAPHAIGARTPRDILSGLTDGSGTYGSLLRADSLGPAAAPSVLDRLPAPRELILGRRPGLIGSTCAALLLAAAVYLIYRHYVPWYVPAVMLLSAWCVAAVGPVWFSGPADGAEVVWTPLLREALAVGLLYCACQMFAGQLLLAVLLVSASMTTRPVTARGGVVFAAGCGALVMAGQMYTTWGGAAFAAIMVMETFTPALDTVWLQRPFGMKRRAA